MNAPLPRALVFMNGRNCARYVGAALESLAWQTHPGLHVLYVDDASDDGSEALAREALAQFFHGRHTLVRNPQPLGKAHNAHVHLRANRAHGEFVAVLDADDQLLSATIVAELAAEYAAGWDVVWTNYETDAGQPGHCGPLDPFLPPRQQGWKTSHFFSFRTELLDGIDAGYFQDETGRWLGAACDRALALPVLDQTRRYRHLPVRAYRYTVSNPASHHNRDPQSVNFSSREQQRCAEVVDAKPPLPCRRWLFGPQAAGDAALAALQQRLLLALAGRAAPPVATATAAVSTPPAPAAAEETWSRVAAAELHARCPGLLALALDGQAPPPPVALLWTWWQWLQRGPAAPRVLQIGAGPLSAAWTALVQGLGGRCTVVSGDAERAMALYARLDSAGLAGDVRHAPAVAAEFEGHAGQFPNLALLPEALGELDAVIVAAGEGGELSADAVLALPMVAPRLGPRFRLNLWAPDEPRTLQQALALWRRAAPELAYVERALGGRALVVHAAE
ncbi:glycosyltransferase family 2 protein [Piscinibacter sakaiensis]|uniref:Glycosyltransferase 2-like domain-containing protein n=1 Tax=Piscinibacter sakaiensis TaxID=1547922 RepID=A0A0K8P7P2_PISS1|nr:glycosyltransferase family A protein [Piscinibacter sakaiensis]GAP38210.1 hypothetical protein ISF6_4404 [Piscinibacter sakaiensis]